MRNREKHSKPNDIFCRRSLDLYCLQSVLIGTLASTFVGLTVGACIGLSNEIMASPDELEELRLGFAEYTMYGMGFFGAAVAALVGTVGSVTGAYASNISKKPIVGIIFGITGTILFMISIGLLSQPWVISLWKQETMVWTIGGITGASIAGCLATDNSRRNSAENRRM